MTDTGYKIGFMGAGKMAEALIAALLTGKLTSPDNIIAADPVPQRRDIFRDRFNIRVTDENRQVLLDSDIVFLAFKPQNFPTALEGLTPDTRPDHIIVSIMAGVRIESIHKILPGRVIRVMPNTPCLVGQMAAGFAPAPDVSPADLEIVRNILQSAGLALEVRQEDLDAVTGLSGSGPAFVAYLIDSFIAAGTAEGLSEEVARNLALKTFAGTAKLLTDWNLSPRELIDMVSSPGGTTVAGREILESSQVKQTLIDTIKRAAERSRQLG